MGRRLVVLVALVLAAGAIAVARGANSFDPNAVGPRTGIPPNGRRLAPPGKLTPIGNHPGGGALTLNGHFLWTLSAGRGHNDIRIVRVQQETKRKCRVSHHVRRCHTRKIGTVGAVVQVIPMPGVDGGITMGPDGQSAYVSGNKDSDHKDEQVPANVPGKEGDVIHVFGFNTWTGRAYRHAVIPVPPPSGSPTPQNFPPTNTKKLSWPRDLAVTKDGKTLLAALNLADRAAIVDTHTHAVRYVQTGSYPYGAAITRDGHGLISNESDGTVSVIDLASGTKIKDITVGKHLSHPEGIAVDPKEDRAFVAIASEDKVVEIDTKAMTVKHELLLQRPQGVGTEPTQVSVSRDGCYLTSADSGEDAVAVYALRSGCPGFKATSAGTVRGKRASKVTTALPEPQLLARVPTAAYPVMAGVTPGAKSIAWISAKGLGVGPNPNGPNPLSPNDSDDHINSFQFLPSIVTGAAGILPFPTPKQFGQYNAQALAQVQPVNGEGPPSGTPITPPGPGQKIQHVFYIVRENRTYDQVLGDSPRGNGDPHLELFPSSITPNAHALANRFPLLDHVFANSEASIDGHFWSSAANVSDYVTKNWHANYGARDRPYDFGVFAVTWPAKRFIFDRATADGVSYFNYGEAIAGTVPLTDKDRNAAENQQVQQKFANSDLGETGHAPHCYANDSFIGKNGITQQEVWDSALPAGAPPGSESRYDCFNTRFTTQLLTNTVPALNYLVLPSDHTNGLGPGKRTPQAMIADNDYALGQIVDRISHSSIWPHSLILVVEDDSQDGADHLDAHRMPAFAISPYAKQGAVVHTRYDFPSVLRTLEIPLGMRPMNLFDALATPMYDAFSATPSNSAPYTALKPNQNLVARNPNTAANRAASRGLNMTAVDQVPQRVLDRILWQAVHGPHSKAPPPGPNAVKEQGPGD